MGPYIMGGMLGLILVTIYYSVPESIVLFVADRSETVRRYFELE